MRGSLRERSPGKWAIILDSQDAAGKRKRRWHSFTGSKRQAQVECARLISELQNGTTLDSSKASLREYLARWLAHVETQVSPRTYENYKETLQFWIVPALGNVTLAKLQPAQIAQAYAHALAHGGRNGAGLSPRTVGAMHRVLTQALKQAVSWNLIPRNPAAFCKPPRVERRGMKVLDVDATAALIERAKGGRLYMPILFLALCGARRAEVTALRWSRLNGPQLAISTSIEQTRAGTREKPPKSGRARTIVLPAMLTEELRRHRIAQAEELLRLGIRQTNETHICLREDARPWTPRELSFAVTRLIRASGLPRIRLHDLRHGHATHLLQANVHPKVVQERLGHACIMLTLDTYSHVMPSMQADAADSIDIAMQAALKRKGG